MTSVNATLFASISHHANIGSLYYPDDRAILSFHCFWTLKKINVSCVFLQIEVGRKNIDSANQMVNKKLNSLVAWKSSSTNQENCHEAEVKIYIDSLMIDYTALILFN